MALLKRNKLRLRIFYLVSIFLISVVGLYSFLSRDSIHDDQVLVYLLGSVFEKKSDPLVFFVGSSSIRRWDSLELDFPKIKVTRRGLSSATLVDINKKIDFIFYNIDAKALVLYGGVNDIVAYPTITSEDVVGSFEEFVERVDRRFPGVCVFFIGIFKSPGWEYSFNKIDEINNGISVLADQVEHIKFIDTTFLSTDKRNLFDDDLIHLSVLGYQILTQRVNLSFVESSCSIF